jgi:NAD(P)-dependent dehydrogenase (short-subunit alcohol dehydrogenase family)
MGVDRERGAPPDQFSERDVASVNLNGLLAGHRALVTGAARGIGAAIALVFEEAGASVVRADLVWGDRVQSCDVTDERSVTAIFKQCTREGPLDDVVHAAGIAEIGSVEEMSLEAFRRVIEVNLIGSFIVARAASKSVKPGGNIVFIASQAGLKGGALWGAYSASKGGVLRLADCLTEELADRGIRVNSISPGNVDTAMLSSAHELLAQRQGRPATTVRQGAIDDVPMGRLGNPEEIGRAAVALCSGILSYANGSNIILDGGELSR